METNSGAPKIVCFCNDVPERKVVECIRLGAKTLGQIYDQTQAGSGPCGGSCRDMIKALIAQGSSSSSNASAATPETEAQPSELVHGISLFNRRYF